MHLSDFMADKKLSDEQVAKKIKRSRVTVSRIRRRLVRPNWTTAEAIKRFTKNAVTVDDFSGPLNAERRPR